MEYQTFIFLGKFRKKKTIMNLCTEFVLRVLKVKMLTKPSPAEPRYTLPLQTE